MKTPHVSSASRQMHVTRVLIATGLVLLVPLVAMAFTEEVDWGPLDFVIIGTLLAGAGLTYEYIATKVVDSTRLMAVGVVIAAAVLLLWAELAVGVFGSPFAGS